MNYTEIKGINVRKVSAILIGIGFVLFLSILFCAAKVHEWHAKVDLITDDYIQSQQEIYSLQIATDLLSAKSRQYVMTGEEKFLKEYFAEVNESRRRETAVSRIEQAISEVGRGAADSIRQAYEKSVALQQEEMHAMHLVSVMYDESVLPREITGVPLSPEETHLTATQRREEAYAIVFGDDYSNAKLSIRDSVDDAVKDLLGELGAYKQTCATQYNRAFKLLICLIIAAALNFAVIAFCLHALILHPLKVSIDAMQKEKPVPGFSSYELNFLAETYNKVFEDNAATRLHLRQKAERDELTGLLNRSAFNDLADFYKNATESLACMIIDVDKFKEVNDTYGHQTGDLALKRVAELLKGCFRANDFPVRYGGDEFVVIMTEIAPEQRGVIERKLNYINETLQNIMEEGMPKLSVSVGIAFSAHGYSEGLFERADAALYETKKNGRCSFTFAE